MLKQNNTFKVELGNQKIEIQSQLEQIEKLNTFLQLNQ